MAGIPEGEALAAKRRGAGLAKHLGVRPGTARHDAIVYGTARKAGWRPSREVNHSLRDAHRRRKMRPGG